MAIGDQVHHFITSYPSGTYRPASGVEVVFKEINMQIIGSGNYHWCYHRTASNVYNYDVVIGGNKYQTYYSLPTAAQYYQGDSGDSQMAQYSVPINYDNYIGFNYSGGTPSGSKIAGFITKE